MFRHFYDRPRGIKFVLTIIGSVIGGIILVVLLVFLFGWFVCNCCGTG